jgi:hypothetical protein
MIGNQLITQVVIAGLAIGIVLTYIQPTIKVIGEHQDSISQTVQELETITEVNQKLTERINQVNAIPQSDKTALAAYLPETIDSVQVLKDISAITEKAEILMTELSYEGDVVLPLPEGSTLDSADQPIAHTFTLSVSSTYVELKRLLVLLEKNNYPLEIHVFSLTPLEGGMLETSFEIVTYSHK